MAKKGAPSITIAGTTFGANDCIQSASLTVGGTDLTYICDGDIKTEVGSQQVTLQFSIAMENTDTTQQGNLARGTSGACEYHPFGDSASNIEHTTTNGTITNYTENGGPDAIVIADVTVAWDDLTTGAAV